jgi:hypothetical protein
LNVPDILRDKKAREKLYTLNKKTVFVKSIDHCSVSVELFEGCFTFKKSDVSSLTSIDDS